MPAVTAATGVPRAVHLRFPMGNPIGEPFKVEQQMTVVKATLDALVEIQAPGTIKPLAFRWRRF